MAETDSTKVVDDVGPSRSETLAEVGIGTVGELAGADPELLATDAELDPGTAEKIVENAQLVLNDEEGDGELGDDVEDDWDAVEDDVESDNRGEWTEFDPFYYVGDGGPADGYSVALEFENYICNHIIHVVLEEATKAQQMKNTSRRDTAYGLAAKLMAVSLEADGDIDTNVILSTDELRSFYRALTRGSEEYARRSGISDMYGALNSVRDVVNEQRQIAMHEN